MKIRTEEGLSQFISDELAWRKKELTDIRNMIQQRTLADRRRRSLIRCGVALLYAHFEGFTKQTFRAYLEYIASQRLRYEEIAPNLSAVVLCNMLSSIQGAKKPSSYKQAVNLFLDAATSRAKIPFETAIDTESNLSSRVFREITWILGIDYKYYETKEKLIDSHLLAKRNHIAHGQYLELGEDEYGNLHENVIEILETFRNQIENAVARRTFIRTN